jgi:hypothetical protein
MRTWLVTMGLVLGLTAMGCGGDDEADTKNVNPEDTLALDVATDPDAVTTADVPAVQDVDPYNPYQDTYVPPQDTVVPPQDTYVPPQDTYQPPKDLYQPPTDTNTNPGGCSSDLDCPGGMKCCPAMIPGMPSECKADCGGGLLPDMPTCTSSDDCVGGQTCKDLMGFAALCISECNSDDDCDGHTCKELGAMGFALAKMCECNVDADCPDPALKCCTIDLMGFINIKTCLTECIDLGGLF